MRPIAVFPSNLPGVELRTATTRLTSHWDRVCLSALIFVICIVGCSTVPSEIPTDIEPKEYFQRAQEAVVERGDYDTALRYYETFVERHGDDIQLTVEAEYEIAFIHYKQGEIDLAKAEFDALIDKYFSDNAQLLPRWPLILTEKVVASLEQPATAEE